MNILWIQGKIVEVDQKSLKTYLTALLRCLAPFVRPNEDVSMAY
jgi:hypothetical protein